MAEEAESLESNESVVEACEAGPENTEARAPDCPGVASDSPGLALPDHEPADLVLLQARQTVYQFFALALSDPRSARWTRLLDSDFQELAAAAAELVREQAPPEGFELACGEQPRSMLDLAPILDGLRRPAEELNREFEDVFGLLLSQECPPYETEYCPQTDATFRAHQLADVAGFYRAFGLQMSGDMPERPDHASIELEFMAWLTAKEVHADRPSGPRIPDGGPICRDAQRKFLGEHLCWWLPALCHALDLKTLALAGSRRDGGPGYLVSIARALSAFVHCERAILDVNAPTELLHPTATCPPAFDACSSCAGALGGALPQPSA